MPVISSRDETGSSPLVKERDQVVKSLSSQKGFFVFKFYRKDAKILRKVRKGFI